MNASRLCYALDFEDAASALASACAVRESVGMFKVGLELFLAEGPDVVRRVAALGRPVFLDLKLHDIPETVARAVARLGDLPSISWVTVHASGGSEMLRATRQRCPHVRLAAVTVLTSMNEQDLRDGGCAAANPSAQAAHLGKLAIAAGVDALVCSPADLRHMRAELGAVTLITPGVRPDGVRRGDQKRVATPRAAIADGADWLVVGRPIRDAASPAAAARAIAEEIATALQGATSS